MNFIKKHKSKIASRFVVAIIALPFFITVLSVFVLGGLNLLQYSYDLNYKITVEVQTPEGIVTGSAVRNVTNSTPMIDLINWPGGNPATLKGEAVVIDLGKRGVMYGLIYDDSERDLYRTFWGNKGGATTAKGIRFFNALDIGDSRVLPKKYWPSFVTFTDPDDPKSVERIVYNKGNQDKEKMIKIFGEGVSIKEIKVIITDESITDRVDDFLPENAKKLKLARGEFEQGE